MSEPFRVAQASADHWGLAAKACLDRLGGVRPDDDVGFIYVTERFAGEISSIVTVLRETTGLATWIGAAGFGVFAGDVEIHDGGAVALMVGRLPPGSVRLFGHEDAQGFLREHAAWLAEHPGSLAVVHGDPTRVATAELIADLAEASGGFLVGGLTAAAEPDERIAGRASTAALSGAFFGGPTRFAVGISQGCQPIGPVHRVTEGAAGIVMALDGRNALEVLREEAGELIARDLRRAAGYIHVALPIPGDDQAGYTVRGLTGIDPDRGWLAVGAELGVGDRLMLVRRDANAAQKDLRRMAAGLAERVAALGGRPLGGIYISCVGRGPHMFGEDGGELTPIAAQFPGLPLVGFSANGEICGNRLYTYTGVLAIFVGGAQ